MLIFLGATKSSKESTSSIWAMDGTEKPLCIAPMCQKRFIFLMYCLRFDDHFTRTERQESNKLAPIKELYDKFVASCKKNFTPAPDCSVDETY